MGFCLFEYARTRGFFFAVNSSMVQAVTLHEEKSAGRPVCLLELAHPAEGFEALAVGTEDEIAAILKQSAKIGVSKASVNLIGTRGRKPTPLLINRPDRVLIVRELVPEEFLSADDQFVTASELFMSDGKKSRITERPAMFVSRTNANGKMPMLRVDP